MITACYITLPDGTLLCSVVVKHMHDKPVIVTHIANGMDDCLKWQRKELAKQIYTLVHKFLNQRKWAYESVNDSDSYYHLNVLMGHLESLQNASLDVLCKWMLSHETEIMRFLPSQKSKQRNWRVEVISLVDFTKHILNSKAA